MKGVLHLKDHVLISIVVLAYNCEKFIAKCLDSLCNQDYPEKNYEVLITDDGSKDNTGKICDEYAEKFPFIHVTHTENFGTSHARNVVLPQCKGDYITFCDSDDYVSPQLISLMTKAIEKYKDADMFAWKYTFELENNVWPVYDAENLKAPDIYDSENFCLKVLNDISYGGYTWNKLTRREIAQQIAFNDELMVMDDHWWVVNVLNSHKEMRVYDFNYSLYCYVQHQNFGQSRLPGRIYTKDGMSWFVKCLENELTLKNLSPRIIEQIKGCIYYWSTSNMYQMGRKMSDETRAKIKLYLNKYAGTYYFHSHYPISWKLRALVRHVLIILGVHKFK